MKKEYKVKENEAGIRIDKYLSNKLSDTSRTLITSMINDGLVTLNSKPTKPSYKVEVNDVIYLETKEATDVDIKPEDLKLDIIYSDDDVAIINKPSGMVVHPAIGNTEGTLVNGLMYELDDFSGIKGEIRPGIVHRIDKNTSGLLMIAKNDYAHEFLSNQLKEHSVNRIYVGLVYGVISENLGRIEAPIGRDPKDRKKMAVVEDGKKAITNFKVIERYKKFTLVEFKLETGRTHQIRVHMKYIGYPLVGDPEYGPKKLVEETGQFLHAKTLGFIHPKTKKYMEFSVDIPPYFKDYLDKLEK